MEVIVFLAWLFFAVLVGVLASKRGRNPYGWFLLAMLFSPLLMAIALWVVPDLEAQAQKTERGVEAERRHRNSLPHSRPQSPGWHFQPDPHLPKPPSPPRW